jgi:drug/metabolite transporter (DMT)-like permease
MTSTPIAGQPAKPQVALWQLYTALLIGILAAASSSILIRNAQNAGASSLVISAWRVTLAALVITPVVLGRHRQALAKLTRTQVGMALLAGAYLAIHFASWITSLEYTSILTSVTLVTTNPLIVALVSPFLLREKLSRVTFLAILLAIAGGIIVSVMGNAGAAPRQDSPLLGAVLAIVGAFGVATYFMIGRQLRKDVPLLPYIWLTYGGAGIVLIIMAAFSQAPVAGLSLDAYIAMTLCALIPQLVGHSMMNYALGHLSAAFVSLTVLSEPIFSTILAIPILGELPDPNQLPGSALIIIALIFASREESKQAVLQRKQ